MCTVHGSTYCSALLRMAHKLGSTATNSVCCSFSLHNLQALGGEGQEMSPDRCLQRAAAARLRLTPGLTAEPRSRHSCCGSTAKQRGCHCCCKPGPFTSGVLVHTGKQKGSPASCQYKWLPKCKCCRCCWGFSRSVDHWFDMSRYHAPDAALGLPLTLGVC